MYAAIDAIDRLGRGIFSATAIAHKLPDDSHVKNMILANSSGEASGANSTSSLSAYLLPSPSNFAVGRTEDLYNNRSAQYSILSAHLKNTHYSIHIAKSKTCS